MTDFKEVHPPTKESKKRGHINDLTQYREMYDRSIKDPEGFWREMGTTHISWFQPFTHVQHGSFERGDISYYINGKLNACYNCIDRHVLEGKGNKCAIVWEGDEENDIKSITYNELFQQICQFSNLLRRLGVKKGDSICIYMPMIIEAVIAILSCARIGAPHSVVFAGFSSDALKDRIIDGNCHYIITCDEGKRGGKIIPLKYTVDEAIQQCNDVKHVIIYQHTHNTSIQYNKENNRDIIWQDAIKLEKPYCPCEVMDSEDPLFFLFTSGSTGRPKGIQHSTAGYLLYALLTSKYVFDLHDDDIHACMADIGWVTGHSYIVYGPLSLGCTTFIFESTPLYPTPDRYWRMVERHKFTTFYTAPTAIRALMKYGDNPVKPYDRSSLRVLGSVGEPINPEAWRWYYQVVGNGTRPIVDTYWQTETGGIIITPLPGAIPTKPGSATLPFFGIEPVVLSPEGIEQHGNNVSGVLAIKQPWPGISRTIYGDHERYIQVYMSLYKGYYFTGDGCIRDHDGYYWITGRVDDVVNVSGHRIGSAEIESALILNHYVAESAVIGIPHDVKGQCLFAYVIVKNNVDITHNNPILVKELQLTVRQHVGAFAIPDYIILTQGLPKTRSGKIMRRLLRKIACQETDHASLGDITTLADESVVYTLIEQVNALLAHSKKA